MAVRIGVDVGGTFTKAVACDPATGAVVARSIVPTTHSSASGVADGVIRVMSEVSEAVTAAGRGPVELVAHSTTQAVNALLEGDTALVGILGMGRRPDLRRARKRTSVREMQLAPGRRLTTQHSFMDLTAGLDERRMRETIHRMTEEGAEVIVASEAFGVDDARGEWTALQVAEDMGVIACGGHELTGLYGLEMRTVTAAINASILPTALATARLVEEAAAADLPGVSLLAMKGDGGAVSLKVMKRHPLLTAFSGPAASVAGALRRTNTSDAIVVEVGGTSTNISAIRSGRPVLSYVRVLDHVTCVRSLDVRVAGVAGGSLMRIGRRKGRVRLLDVGPRSAHIAGLPYACFAGDDELREAAPKLIAPKPGDPAEYLVLETPGGRRLALTLTCAANALGEVMPGTYAVGNSAVARNAFEIAGRHLGIGGQALAQGVLEAASTKLARVVAETTAELSLDNPPLLGVGGGAGAVIPFLARHLGTAWSIPEDAEVISSIGDALSFVRVEIERSLSRPTVEAVSSIHREAEAAALRAGAAPSSVQIESVAVPERGALRVTATGVVALQSSASVVWSGEAEKSELAEAKLGPGALLVFRSEFFSVYCDGSGDERNFAVFDRTGAITAAGRGTVLSGRGSEVAAAIDERVPALVRNYGPVAVAPAVRLVRGSNLIDLTLISKPDEAREAALAECSVAGDEEMVVLLSRS